VGTSCFLNFFFSGLAAFIKTAEIEKAFS
jgi:hypothetical protein